MNIEWLSKLVSPKILLRDLFQELNQIPAITLRSNLLHRHFAARDVVIRAKVKQSIDRLL